jgi:hypothetical protein
VSVRLSDDEAWEELERAHTGVFTTLTRAGWPVSLPIWFVVVDRAIYVQTPERAKKLVRIGHDDRGCFLVERGERWAELAAVELPVRASVVHDPALAAVVSERLDAKYRPFRTASSRLPAATRSHYSGSVLVRLEPAGKLVSWDNARLRLLG